MSGEPIDDIEAWSKKLSPWRQDCLRRLAISNELTEEDLGELLAMIKQGAGFALDDPAPAPVPFAKAHFGGVKHQPIVLKGIANVTNVNRLVHEAQLTFCPAGLTVVYGRNGSGKSGFVRILRTACRTRIEKAEKLRVLGDVYGASSGPQSADIIIDSGGGDMPVKWQPGMAAAPELMQVAVFDTASAQLYVDGGHQIRFLPFGLALPHRLNTVCLSLKGQLETERAAAVGDKISLTEIAFPTIRNTKAQAFNIALTKATTQAEIDKAADFEAADQTQLDEIVKVLAAGAAAAVDVSALATWTDSVAKECEGALGALGDTALATLATLRNNAVAARQAAQLAAGALFTDEPLTGVGSESWRALWEAARDYSVKEAYDGLDYPVVEVEDGHPACVLCQQPLLADAAARMLRFQKYMDDTLDVAATKAEKAVADASAALPELKLLRADDLADRIEQVRKRDAALADSLSTFQTAIVARREEAAARLAGTPSKPVPVLVSPVESVKAMAKKLQEAKDALTKAGDTDERAKLAAEQAELEDRKILAANKVKLEQRKALRELEAAYAAALAEVQTKGITQRANELLDTHLTTAVVTRFDAERSNFDIMHLKVGLARKSGQTRAEFEVDPQTKLTKVTSEILSEGEQRALALAGFLTEVALTDGSGPIIVDDPVSSLDRERCAKVAQRLAEEAGKRQVVVFTHDIIFFNELCEEAHKIGIDPVTIALFSDKKVAGRVDPTGIGWKGAPVKKRIGRIKDAFAPLPKIHSASPAEYEMQIKHLYGRLRDTYERVVEEIIFCDIVRRGVDVVQTQKLRMVHLSHPLAIRFHEGMTKANTHSHDNPAADTVPVPPPEEFLEDVAFLEALIADLKAESQAAEAARPQMKLKS
ncbi:AAA family ATPase [Qipengyuania sediminis]|uniref:AAA family ATPase n=1 Tax=Qipengyuania sediminis TaxID=1532023 RepID=UPI001059F94C|nr:AAA family ATPase [Qipengyuania sediminis]